MHCGVKTILYLWIMADKSPYGENKERRHKKKGPGSCLKTIINKKHRDYENETISRNGRSGLMATSTQQAEACTGITLKTADGTSIPARTIEWGGSDLNSKYVIVPRGYTQQSYIPGGQKNGLQFTAKYGYVGLAVEQEEFVAEGLNEKGLSAGLFYFPRYGQYEAYSEANRQSSIADLQLVSWILGNFSTVDEVIEGMKDVHVVAIDPRASTVHWRITEPSGRQIVIEITEGKVNVFENKLGVLTNSPGFEWQMTNLNNYVNLYPGTAQAKTLDGTALTSFGAGSGFLGIPGDVTPPSRFVRAAFYQATAPKNRLPKKPCCSVSRYSTTSTYP